MRRRSKIRLRPPVRRAVCRHRSRPCGGQPRAIGPQGEWTGAHELAQATDDAPSAWVHAYLHRVEGDDDNAAYWYRRAKRQPSKQALTTEWESIAGALLRE
jgi:hypothetical protein